MSQTRCAMKRYAVNRGLIVVFATAALILCMTRPTLAQCEAGQLTSPKGEVGNLFGSVSISGDAAVVGDITTFSSLGAAYVYRRGPDGPGDWQLEAVLMAPEPDPDDVFGGAVVSGDVIVVGAPGANAPDFQSGAVYVYRYDPDGSGTWNYETTLTASDGDFDDIFGWSMSLDSDVLLVGARNDENDGVSQSGSAYVFRYDPRSKQWIEEAKLTDPEGEENDLFGVSVAIKGDVALVGAHGNDDAGLGTGAAFVFRYDPQGGGTWVFQQQLNALDGGVGDRFGSSVATTGEVVIVGAPRHRGSNGAAYVFAHDGKAWALEIKLTAADPVGPFPFFGSSISISGDTILIGAPQDFELGGDAGAAHLFRNNGTGWEEVIKLTASDGGPGEFFGGPISIHDGIGFIAAPSQSGQPGTVYIFDLDPTPGDVDCNGRVGVADLLLLLAAWGPCPDCDAPLGCPADLNDDCTVGVSDLLILLANWGEEQS